MAPNGPVRRNFGTGSLMELFLQWLQSPAGRRTSAARPKTWLFFTRGRRERLISCTLCSAFVSTHARPCVRITAERISPRLNSKIRQTVFNISPQRHAKCKEFFLFSPPAAPQREILVGAAGLSNHYLSETLAPPSS